MTVRLDEDVITFHLADIFQRLYTSSESNYTVLEGPVVYHI